MLEWERGRQLKQYGSVSFTYDAGGVRQSKTANGVTTSYFTEGNRVHKEERSDGKTLIYAYDESGIASITYNGTLYFVQKNFQGDIVALVDRDGTVVAKYVYDAWGNTNVYDASGTLNTSSSFIGNINPFRYRGYYYDAETGLYYLQTRYYDPQAGRFLNADSVDYIAPDLIGGLNLYAYCNNNPVMYSDPEGQLFSMLLIGALIGFAVNFAISATTQLLTEGEVNWGTAVIDGAFGAVSGALAVTGIGAVATGVINGALSLVNSTITTGIENNWSFSATDAVFIGLSSLASGIISGITRGDALKRLLPVKSMANMAQTGINNAIASGRGVKQMSSAMSRYVDPHILRYFTDDLAESSTLNFYQTMMFASMRIGVTGLMGGSL